MKRTASINLFLSATISLLLFACKKGFNDAQTNPSLSESNQRSSLTSLTTRTIYIGGSESGQAKYWIDNGSGTPTSVSLNGGGVNGIVATGGHVYACGSATNPATGIPVAAYWVDGNPTPTYLPSGTHFSYASGIAVVGGHVYVTARVDAFLNIGEYWVDGVRVSLGSGEANGISADGNNLYIVNSGSTPSYWKVDVTNPASPVTTLVTLPPLQNQPNLHPHAAVIAAYGGNVYTAGGYSASIEKAVRWINTGTPVELNAQIGTRALAIAADAFGSYVAGTCWTDFNNPKIGYWDQFGGPDFFGLGVQTTAYMGITTDPATGEVFVCGTEIESGSSQAKAKYWVRGMSSSSTLTLNSGSADAYAYCIALGQ
jgi:hypothetical protein